MYVRTCVFAKHVLFFLDRLQNGSEEVLGGGVAGYDYGTGGLWDLPGRVTHEQEEGTTLCVQKLCIFLQPLFTFVFRRRSQVM